MRSQRGFVLVGALAGLRCDGAGVGIGRHRHPDPTGPAGPRRPRRPARARPRPSAPTCAIRADGGVERVRHAVVARAPRRRARRDGPAAPTRTDAARALAGRNRSLFRLGSLAGLAQVSDSRSPRATPTPSRSPDPRRRRRVRRRPRDHRRHEGRERVEGRVRLVVDQRRRDARRRRRSCPTPRRGSAPRSTSATTRRWRASPASARASSACRRGWQGPARRRPLDVQRSRQVAFPTLPRLHPGVRDPRRRHVRRPSRPPTASSSTPRAARCSPARTSSTATARPTAGAGAPPTAHDAHGALPPQDAGCDTPKGPFTVADGSGVRAIDVFANADNAGERHRPQALPAARPTRSPSRTPSARPSASATRRTAASRRATTSSRSASSATARRRSRRSRGRGRSGSTPPPRPSPSPRAGARSRPTRRCDPSRRIRGTTRAPTRARTSAGSRARRRRTATASSATSRRARRGTSTPRRTPRRTRRAATTPRRPSPGPTPASPGANQFHPVSPTRDYTFPWTNEWFTQGLQPGHAVRRRVPGRQELRRLGGGDEPVRDAQPHARLLLPPRLHRGQLQRPAVELRAHRVLPRERPGARRRAGRRDAAPPGVYAIARNNANMATLPGRHRRRSRTCTCGSRSRARFYPPCVDGDYDAGVIGHEYAHMIENRMIGKGDQPLRLPGRRDGRGRRRPGLDRDAQRVRPRADRRREPVRDRHVRDRQQAARHPQLRGELPVRRARSRRRASTRRSTR